MGASSFWLSLKNQRYNQTDKRGSSFITPYPSLHLCHFVNLIKNTRIFTLHAPLEITIFRGIIGGVWATYQPPLRCKTRPAETRPASLPPQNSSLFSALSLSHIPPLLQTILPLKLRHRSMKLSGLFDEGLIFDGAFFGHADVVIHKAAAHAAIESAA